MVLLTVVKKCIPRTIMRSRVPYLLRSQIQSSLFSSANPLHAESVIDSTCLYFPPNFEAGVGNDHYRTSIMCFFLDSFNHQLSGSWDHEFSPDVVFKFLQWINPYIPRHSKPFHHALVCKFLKAGILSGGGGPPPPPPADNNELQSYVESGRISGAYELFTEACLRHADMCLFHEFTEQEMDIKRYHCWVASQCRVKTADHRMQIMREMEEIGFTYTLSPAELRIHSLCVERQYDQAFRLLLDDDMAITTFIGNLFLLHSLKSRAFYKAWKKRRTKHGGCGIGDLIATFSRGTRLRPDCHPQHLEEAIQRCFPLDVFTYNLLLRKLAAEEGIVHLLHSRTIQLFGLICRMCLKGFFNSRSLDALVHGLSTDGSSATLQTLLRYLSEIGFYPNPTPDSELATCLNEWQKQAGFKDYRL